MEGLGPVPAVPLTHERGLDVLLARGMGDSAAGAPEELPDSSRSRALKPSKAQAQASSYPPPTITSNSSKDSSPQMQRPYAYHGSSGSDSPPGGAQYREAYSSNSPHDAGAQSSMSQTQPRLPPMQRFEGPPAGLHAQQSQYQPMNGMPIPHQHQPPAHSPNVYAPNQYSYSNGGVLQPAPPMMGSVANGQNGLARFPIPPQAPLDSRSMSGGRHKKEIKRRTKSGCLTCRKRRIKCDEGQPACRNCAKSKRECLGYDPIFKSQAGPAPIQPAPASDGSPPLHPGATPSLPSNPYQTSTYSGRGGPLLPSNGPETPYGYGASLDPALAGGEQSQAMSQANPPLQPERKPKHLNIGDLFALNDIPPQYETPDEPRPMSPATQQEIADFYNYHYGPGLDRLLETDWYTRFGLQQIQQDVRLQHFVSQCIDKFKSRTDDAHTTKAIKSLEARLVWQLATTCRASSTDQDLIYRVETLENLLTGGFLDPSHVPSPPPPSQAQRDSAPEGYNEKYNELSFWHHLGRFVSIRDDRADHTAMRDVANALASLRGILNMLENRDVLYSIAVVRHIGGRMPEFNPQRHLVASTNDSNDEMNKLKVAQQFVETEDQRGTTQVIQRTCSMALRSWVLQKQ